MNHERVYSSRIYLVVICNFINKFMLFLNFKIIEHIILTNLFI